MKQLTVIQARMSSTRLPGKVLMKIGKKTLIDRIIDSAEEATSTSKIFIATSEEDSDDILVKYLEKRDVEIFRGSINNVYSRFYEIVKNEKNNFDSVIRLTADCPLLDPDIIDTTVDKHYSDFYDYTSTGLSKTFPLGQAVEIVKISTFLNLPNSQMDKEDLEHVTRYIWKRPDEYRLGSISYENEYFSDSSKLRLTVDQIEDFILIEKIISGLSYENVKKVSLDEIIKFLSNNPKLIDINKNVEKIIT